MFTLIRPPRPSRCARRRSAGAALAVAGLALTGAALAGCAGASTAQDPPKMPFGWSPSGPSDTPPTWGETATVSPSAGATFALTDPPTRAGATPVTPSITSEAHRCPTRKLPHRWCASAREVYPAIDPSAPCVDSDVGDYRGTTYLCFYGSWTKLDGFPATTKK